MLNVLTPGESVTVPIATAARLLDLVTEGMKINPTLEHEETLPLSKGHHSQVEFQMNRAAYAPQAKAGGRGDGGTAHTVGAHPGLFAQEGGGFSPKATCPGRVSVCEHRNSLSIKETRQISCPYTLRPGMGFSIIHQEEKGPPHAHDLTMAHECQCASHFHESPREKGGRDLKHV